MNDVISLFAGVGGFDLGFERAGWSVVAQVENDERCQAVLRERFPGTEIHGDVREVGGANAHSAKRRESERGDGQRVRDSVTAQHHPGPADASARAALAPVDLICGGFPCQDLSVAGKRAGLDGDRSGLWHEFHRIIAEVAPRWVLVENVPGLLSSNGGRDMGVIVRGLEELGYGWAYRVLDSQYFGVAQRRRRVFIVGHLGTAEPAIRALFPVGTGLPGDTAPSRETREDITGTVGGRAKGEGGTKSRQWPVDVAPTLNTAYADKWGFEDQNTLQGGGMFVSSFSRSGHGLYGENASVAGTVSARDHKDQSTLCVQAVPRRLTPRECERLQGFPDDWTLVNYRGKPMSDGPRYRMMGNAVTVNVAEWIGRRILEAQKC